MKKFVIARTAKFNPSIAGRTLYLSRTGLWTLDVEHARKFDRRSEAEEQCVKDLEGCRVEVVAS